MAGVDDEDGRKRLWQGLYKPRRQRGLRQDTNANETVCLLLLGSRDTVVSHVWRKSS